MSESSKPLTPEEARDLVAAKAALAAELESKNSELEAFCYSVSHDLRAPLRGIDGFSQALLEDYHDKIDETGQKYLASIRKGTQKMGTMIDDLLRLSQISRGEVKKKTVDLSQLAREVVDRLRVAEPERKLKVIITAGMSVEAHPSLLGATASDSGRRQRFSGMPETSGVRSYSAITSPDPPISLGRSFILGRPSGLGSTVSW